MDSLLKKQELLHWLQSVDDIEILLQIEQIKTKEGNIDKLLTLDEARKISLSKIEKWKEK
jgi:hypothetical protein